MKKLKKTAWFVLVLCILAAALTASAWANDEESVEISCDKQMYAGGTYTIKVWDNNKADTEVEFDYPEITGGSYGGYAGAVGDGKAHKYTVSVNPGVSQFTVKFKNILNGVNNYGSHTFDVLPPTTSAAVTGGDDNPFVGAPCYFSLTNASGLHDISWSAVSLGGAGEINGGAFVGTTAGQVTINATARNEIDADVYITPKTITVKNAPVSVTGIAIQRNGQPVSSIALRIGDGATLTPVISPEGADNTEVFWNSTNPSAVTVNNGVIYRAGTGEAYITATSAENGNIVAGCLITEEYVEPEPTLAISPAQTIKQQTQLLVYANGTENVTETCIWTSSNPGVAYVSDTQGTKGLVTPVTNGTTTISARYVVGGTDKTLTCNIAVSGYTPETPTRTLTLDPTSMSLTVGATKQISARCEGGNCTSQCAWVTGNASVATVSNGVVTAKGVGNTTITAMLYDGKELLQQSCTVTVTAPALVHTITSGNYGTFDGKNPLVFTTNDIHYNFKGIYVDGYALTNGNQYLEQSSPAGYIQVALNPAYMAYLSSANYHTIQIVSQNGTAPGYFRTYGTSYNVYGVRTGDESHIELWAALCVLSVLGAGAILIMRRKELFGR